MSDSNVGGRKNRSGINHIWIINGIIHNQLRTVKNKPIVFQQVDYQQMFDSMDIKEACGDIFNYGVNDDHLTMLHEANKNISMNVNTEYGLSNEYILTDRTMQGDTWSSILASGQIDSFGKELIEESPKFLYKLKDEIPIPLLGQTDDLIGVSEIGFKSIQLNAFINVKSADKDLQFGAQKCKF